jgi:hypothetical protein
LVPGLLPPHRKITNRRLAAVTALFFDCGTRRVSQCATGFDYRNVYSLLGGYKGMLAAGWPMKSGD